MRHAFIVILFSILAFRNHAQLRHIDTLRVSDSLITIDGTLSFRVPIRVDSLTALFGKPRISAAQPFGSNNIYFWDRIGIMAYNPVGTDVFTEICICFGRSYDHETRRMFKGVLVVNGLRIGKKTTAADLRLAGYEVSETTSFSDKNLEHFRILAEFHDRRRTLLAVAVHEKK